MDRSQLETKSRLVLNAAGSNIDSTIEDSTSEPSSGKVSPTDFTNFLPWACKQLSVDVILKITKTVYFEQICVTETKSKGSRKSIKMNLLSPSTREVVNSSTKSLEDEAKVMRIMTTYRNDQLVHLKIDKSKYVCREVLMIIGLIIKFYSNLYGIAINSGADRFTIYELCKFLPLSNITEINMDNTFIKEANYDIILDYSKLKVLSLARCKLDDHTVDRIASKLEYPLPASKTLSVLNLSTNRITDRGAKSLGKMLRTNRRLSYLNIASNMITDSGAEAIFNVLYTFPLTVEETLIVRAKYMKYLKRRQELIEAYMARSRDQISGNEYKEPGNKKGVLSVSYKYDLATTDRISQSVELYQKSLQMAQEVCGEFDNPLGKDTFSSDGKLYSNGNNTLAYLNIAYNSISHYSVVVLLKVLIHQRRLPRKPNGLVNVCLEGNPLPEESVELTEIDKLLEIGFTPASESKIGPPKKNIKAAK